MHSEHISIEWTFSNEEKVSFTIPNLTGSLEVVNNIYGELKKESNRRRRCDTIQTWVFRALVASMLIGWWATAVIYGNSYCK